MKTISCDTFHFPYVTFGDTWELLVPFRPQLKFHGGPKKKNLHGRAQSDMFLTK